MRKTIGFVITLIVVAACMPIAVTGSTEIGKYLGLRKMPVPVVGTGSMYPSLFWVTDEGGPDDEGKMTVEEYRTTPHMYVRFPGITIAGKTYIRRRVEYGDMVAFTSSQTQAILENEGKDVSSGFIKRVIGVPGDTIELRDGYVYRNGSVLDEPYIYRPRSTYGGESIKDCEVITVPDGQYVVMGDNRKTSNDSRGELGLIHDDDITFVLPYREQGVYKSLWRDTAKDGELIGTPTLNSNEFYRLVNTARARASVSTVTKNALLEKSATIKGQKILAGTVSYTMAEAIKAAGYHNIVTGEFVSHGHYTEDELLQNLLYFGDTAKLMLKEDYDDIGVAAVTEEVNGCPTQVIVGHLGGYVPAEYEEGVRQSWEGLVNNLETVLPSWEKAQGYEGIDQGILQELLTILRRRLELAREISSAMRNNAWLTDNEQTRIKNDEADAKRAERLIQELNRE